MEDLEIVEEAQEISKIRIIKGRKVRVKEYKDIFYCALIWDCW